MLQQYYMTQFVTDEFRERSAIDPDKIIARNVRRSAVKAGHRPVTGADVAIYWVQLTEQPEPGSPLNAGDWAAHASVLVEDVS